MRKARRLHVMGSLAMIGLTVGGLFAQADDDYLKWALQRAEAIGKAAYQRGRVGGVFDTRFLKTERSYNYKLAATWLTPETIRATARVIQLQSRLSERIHEKEGRVEWPIPSQLLGVRDPLPVARPSP